jgi:predicted DNA-binding transcriptional regulator AlpA
VQRDPEALLTATDFAREARVSKRTVRRWITSGYCPRPFAIGGTPRWRWGVIWQWLKDREKDPYVKGANAAKRGQKRTSAEEDDLGASGKRNH